jgi:CheY-like chemotaxis protein
MTSDSFLGLRVFLVEDEALVAMMLEDMLLDLGCEIEGTASSVADAVAGAAEVQANLAIVDLNLNGCSSLPAADILASRNIPVIFSSGYTAADGRRASRPSVALVKPFGITELARAIRKALQDCTPLPD